jgi:hypothetical protein
MMTAAGRVRAKKALWYRFVTPTLEATAPGA